MGFVVLTFAVIFVLFVSGGLLLFYREAMLQRINAVVDPSGKHGSLSSMMQQTGMALGEVVEHFERLLPKSQAEVSVTQQRLIRAGYRRDSALKNFYGAKVLLPLIFCVVVTVSGVARSNPFLAYLLALGLGFLLPDFWLGRQIKKRQAAIRRGLPDVLDLLVICIEAGQSLDQATKRTSEELRLAQPAITDEFECGGAGTARRPASHGCMEKFCRSDRCRQRAQSGLGAGPVRTVWHQRCENIAHSLRHSSNSTPPEGGGTSCKDHNQAGFSACILHLSIAVSGHLGSGHHHHF